jgi:signal transduction histidine kinase
VVALTDDPPAVPALRDDPGLVLHVLRYSRPTPHPDSFALDDRTLTQPGLCETAAALWERDPDPAPLDPDAHRRGRLVAVVADGLARKTGLCSPDAAWCAGLLAGYFGDTPDVARKLLARWRLPEWVTAAVGFPELPLAVAVALGGSPGLVRVVRAAVRVIGGRPLIAETDADLDPFAPFLLEPARGYAPPRSPGEASAALLPRLLRMAARVRQRSAAALVHELEARVDRLTGAIVQAGVDHEERLRDEKLAALAEFAAGASHEINNPLAIISTNVQLLRSHEEEPERIDRFDAILRQTKRIHELLHGTRQFARPPRPTPALLSASVCLTAVAREFGPDAEARGVSLDLPGEASPLRVWADVGHVRTAVGHLVKNAVAAAGKGGWVRVRVEATAGQNRIVVEDSGPGPSPAAVSHLFDPFYSGRTAGRGRGLGLSIAWRLATLNGGDVTYDPNPGGPTRFVLSLPALPCDDGVLRLGRKSA